MNQITGLLFGLAPVFNVSKISLSPLIVARASIASSTGTRFGLGKTLVISQVAVSLLLVMGAGLFV